MSFVTIEPIDEIVVLRLNRPPVNAIDLELIHAAEIALRQIEEQSRPRAVVMTGHGVSFSAGLDLRKVPLYGPDELREMVCAINGVILQLYEAPMPVVAAINGHAIAGGLCLALACDYRVCVAADCKLGLTETRAGIPYPAGPMTVLRTELSPDVARQLVLLARNIDPQQALQWRVVDELQPAEEVLSRAIEVARDLGSAPADAYARIKSQLRGEAAEGLRRIVHDRSDPLLQHWFGESAQAAAAKVLAGKAGA
jgi:enoyl-CoA hydratase